MSPLVSRLIQKTQEASEAPPEKILAAVQVDSDSTSLLDFAGHLAQWNHAEVELIHVFEKAG
jgi:hypothetical protein